MHSFRVTDLVGRSDEVTRTPGAALQELEKDTETELDVDEERAVRARNPDLEDDSNSDSDHEDAEEDDEENEESEYEEEEEEEECTRQALDEVQKESMRDYMRVQRIYSETWAGIETHLTTSQDTDDDSLNHSPSPAASSSMDSNTIIPAVSLLPLSIDTEIVVAGQPVEDLAAEPVQTVEPSMEGVGMDVMEHEDPVVETGRSRRRRTIRETMYECTCGLPVDAVDREDDRRAVQCKQPGCETVWVSGSFRSLISSLLWFCSITLNACLTRLKLHQRIGGVRRANQQNGQKSSIQGALNIT